MQNRTIRNLTRFPGGGDAVEGRGAPTLRHIRGAVRAVCARTSGHGYVGSQQREDDSQRLQLRRRCASSPLCATPPLMRWSFGISLMACPGARVLAAEKGDARGVLGRNEQ